MSRTLAGLLQADEGQTTMQNRENIPTTTDGETSTREGWVFIGICLFGFAATVFVISISSVVGQAASF
jgi:hypothetical protein